MWRSGERRRAMRAREIGDSSSQGRRRSPFLGLCCNIAIDKAEDRCFGADTSPCTTGVLYMLECRDR